MPTRASATGSTSSSAATASAASTVAISAMPSAGIAVADLVWFPPMKGCKCVVCERRRRELARADELEQEQNPLDKLLREAGKTSE